MERFTVTYRLSAPNAAAAAALAQAVAVEQTVEFPLDHVPPGPIRDHIVGQVESVVDVGPGVFDARLTYAAALAGGELTQFLNVVLGNSSLLPGVRVVGLERPASLLAAFGGPRFGRDGLRTLLGVPERPLLCTALKPVGLSAAELANLAYRFAKSGVDIIKDDHGLADQPYAPFTDRVARCSEAVARANAETGGRAIYVPNVTAGPDVLFERAAAAKAAGAGGLLVAPGLCGWEAMRLLARDDALALPIMSHPAWLGGFVTDAASGISHGVLFGLLTRLAGADATVFPNFGGRFAFSRAECGEIAAASGAPFGGLLSSFPTPGGGMRLDRVGEMLDLFGSDAIFLIGGGLFEHEGGIEGAVGALLEMLTVAA